MSATDSPHEICTVCEAEDAGFYAPGYCSEDCFYTEKGNAVIRQIKTDHTHCTTCYGRLKTVDKPPEAFTQRLKAENGVESAQSVVGFQDYTPRVEKDHGFIYCKCGNIDHYAEITELREVDKKDVLTNLWSLLVRYYHQDQFGEHKPDKELLFDTLKASEMDFAYSIGKSVYSE